MVLYSFEDFLLFGRTEYSDESNSEQEEEYDVPIKRGTLPTTITKFIMKDGMEFENDAFLDCEMLEKLVIEDMDLENYEELQLPKNLKHLIVKTRELAVTLPENLETLKCEYFYSYDELPKKLTSYQHICDGGNNNYAYYNTYKKGCFPESLTELNLDQADDFMIEDGGFPDSLESLTYRTSHLTPNSLPKNLKYLDVIYTGSEVLTKDVFPDSLETLKFKLGGRNISPTVLNKGECFPERFKNDDNISKIIDALKLIDLHGIKY